MNVDPNSAAFPGFRCTDGYGCAKRNPAGEWEMYETGIPLRVYIAIKAMEGYCANSGIRGLPDFIAALAVKQADALIAELNEPTK